MRAIVRFGLKIYFKNIFIAGLNRIPKDGAIIIASNHPSAFFEPILLACLLDRPIYFLTRGDIFKRPWARRILQSMNMITIYRFRDGHENMRKNQESFQACYDSLAKEMAIQIFSEGHNSTGIGLDKLQKGTAKIAFGALNFKPEMDLKIFPVTFYYSDKKKYRGDAFIHCGKFLSVNSFLHREPDDENVKITALTAELEATMSEKVIKIPAGKYKNMLVATLKMYRNEFVIQRNPVVVQDRQIFHDSLNICRHFFLLSEARQEELLLQFKELSRLAKQKNIDLHLPYQKVDTIRFTLIFVIGLAPLLLSITNYLPIFFGARMADKLVKDDDFYGPIKFGIAYFSWLVLYIVSVLLAMLFSTYYLLLYFLLLPFLGIYVIYFLEYVKLQRNSLAMDDVYKEQRKDYLLKFEEIILKM